MKIWNPIKFTIGKIWKADSKSFLIYVLTSVVIAFSSIVNTFTFKEVIDSANRNQTILGLSVFGVILLRLIYEIFKKGIEGLSNYSWYVLDSRQSIYMNKLFVDKIATLGLESFENPETVGLIQRAFARLQMSYKFYLRVIVQTLSAFAELSVSLAIFIFASPLMALVIIIANLIPIIVRGKLSWGEFLIYRADDETRRKFGYTSNIITERETLPEVKVYQAFNFFKERLGNIYEQFTSRQLKIEKRVLTIGTLVDLLPLFAIFLFSIFIANQLTKGAISTGTFVFLFTNVFVFSGALDRLGQGFQSLYSDHHFINDAIEFFDLKPSIKFPYLTSLQKNLLEEKLQKPTIKIENLSFAYPGTDKFVLKNINLEIPFGQNLALIGENGAGKTTLVKLFLRMYDPTEGKILVNGVDLKELPEDILFNLYSTLFQSFGRFNLTVEENLEIASGRKLSEEEMKDYLKFSNAWEFIKDTKNQLKQQLGPEYKDGTDLSGGQWQRLAIARAYAKQAPILILDEPTSAVDAKAETEIFDRLNKEMKGNTLLFISHRFSTIKDAERIVVLHQGEIVEDGNHEKLIKNNGKYANLYTIQAERYLRQ